MNFYNPYYYNIPTNLVQPKIGLLSRIFGKTGASISSFLNGTQKILNIANQTIPLVKQVKPVIGNAKTMFKVMNEFKRIEKTDTQTSTEPNVNKKASTDILSNKSTDKTEGPTFFI